MAKIKYIASKCYACKKCELICSFHHHKLFQPSTSSISVERDHINGKWSWTLNETCDECKDEEQPLCVKFCFYDAIILEEVEN